MLNSGITEIKLFNIRNFKQKNISFSKNHSLFKGKNAVGKTNILEAISFLSPGNGFKKESLANLINKFSIEDGASIVVNFIDNQIVQRLQIIFQIQDSKWSKKYFLNDKKITQQELMNIFQLFWFTELDKVFFIKDKQYHRNYCNRIMCYYDPNLFKLLNNYLSLRKEKKNILKTTIDLSWLQSIDQQLLEITYSIITIKINFIKEFKSFSLAYPNNFFQYQVNSHLEFMDTAEFIKNFKSELLKENQSKGDYSLKSELDPSKIVFYLMHKGIKLNQLSSAQSKMLILSFLLDIAFFLKANKQKITIFLIDEIFDNFDMINLQKVIKYCAENNFQSFFSSTDNFTIKDEIKDLEIINIT